jgi:hypothetical protein
VSPFLHRVPLCCLTGLCRTVIYVTLAQKHLTACLALCSVQTADLHTQLLMSCACMQAARSRQGKMEKSFLSFAATYPTWEPDSAAKQMLLSLGQAPPLRNGLITSESDCHPMQSAIAASLFPGAPRSFCNCNTRSHL